MTKEEHEELMAEASETNAYVQLIMEDDSLSYAERAEKAADWITQFVQASFGLEPGIPLPIPLEWEHRLGGLAG